jgi:fumarylacetoacetase
MAQGRPAARAIRAQVSALLREETAPEALRVRAAAWLQAMADAELALPARIGDYTDFYASIFHATNVGRLFRPDNPLLPNYRWVPIGYHGRASSIVVSGTAIRRPMGQAKLPDAPAPAFAPSKRLDYESELGFIAGTGNRLGHPIAIGEALEHVFGAVLLNDWSARDLQAWEYQPLGPFLAKSFATTISPWIVTMDALEPYRCTAFARAAGDPRPLPYLHSDEDQREGGFAIELEMHLRSAKMKQPMRLSRGNFRDSYWTVAQMFAHQTSNGCNLQPGDLVASGTISGTGANSLGSLMELTLAGKNPLPVQGGETRTFLEDGDEVIERGHCARQGYATIGFGEATGRIVPAFAT